MWCMFISAVATRSRSPMAASRRCFQAGLLSSPIVQSSRPCGRIYPKVIPPRRLNAYCIFHWPSGTLACLCHIAIQCWIKEPLKYVPTESEKSGEAGNCWALPSGGWVVAGAELAAIVGVLANCVFKPRTSSPDCFVSLVISNRSSHSSMSVPGAPCLLVASQPSFLKGCILYQISV